MTSAAENLTHLTGRVLARSPHPSVGRWDTLRIQVESAAPVEQERNMLGETPGTEVDVVANRDELPAGDLAGWGFDGRVRVAGPDVVEALPAAVGDGPPVLTPPADSSPPPADPPVDPPADDGGPVPVL